MEMEAEEGGEARCHVLVVEGPLLCFFETLLLHKVGVLLTAPNKYRIVYLEHAKAWPAEFFLSIGFLRKPTKNTHVARVPQNKIK